jgi:GNAT superfamily N-acetyltransferase
LVQCECGLAYMPGEEEEEREHSLWHSEYLRGPALPQLANLARVGEIWGYSVFCVDREVPLALRCELARVAFVAQRSMPDFPTGYDGSLDEAGEPNLFLLADQQRAVSMAVVCMTDRCWRFGWTSDDRPCLIDHAASRAFRPKIARAWTAREYQQRGLSSALIQWIAETAGLLPADFGWELPPTTAGIKLIRRLTPHKWYGDGDQFAVEETLKLR